MRAYLNNKARCRSCGDVIESKHVHDFVACSCGDSFVDGGLEYLRRGGDNWEELSEPNPGYIEPEIEVPEVAELEKTYKAVVEFSNPTARNHFELWLCESGEQQYWNWMEYREEECDTPDITAVTFDYGDLYNEDEVHTVYTSCGRTREEED